MKKAIINKIKQIFSRMWVIMLMAIFSNKALARFFQTEYGVQVKYGVPYDQPLYGIPPSISPTITPPPLQTLYGIPQPLYGVNPTIEPSIIPPISNPTLFPTGYPVETPPEYYIPPQVEYWTAERILATVFLPLVIIIVVAVGAIVFIKRMRKK